MKLLMKFFVLLACCSQSINGLRILALFPLHGKSHFVMCERLAKGLIEKGHQVDVYSHFPLKKPVPNYNDFSLEGTIPSIVNNITYDYFQQFLDIDLKVMMLRVGNPVCELMNVPVFQQLFEKLKKEQPYDLVIVEVFVSNCFLAWGRHLNVPMVGVMTSALLDWYNEALGNAMNPAVTPYSWSGLFQPLDFWSRLKNTFLYHVVNAQYKYYVNNQNRYIEQFFGPGYPDAAELSKDLDLILVNTHYSIDGIRAFTPAIVPVAGLHIVDDGEKLPNDVQKWLDGSKDGCIYFSFGSMVRIETFPKPVLDALYASFKNIAPVRVLLKIVKPKELMPGLPSNVMTQSWFSQIQVLKHKNIKAFVTHGGLMSTQESLYAGIPIVGIPLFADQQINILSIVRKQAGILIQLAELTEGKVTESLTEILKNSTYRKNAVKLSKELYDRPLSAIDTAIFWIEYISRHGKKALISPMVDMPCWKANLIDVYGFILFVLIVVLYVLQWVFKKIFKLWYPASTDKKSNKIKKN